MTANIDQQEQRKFSQIAETWWDISGESAPLHALNPLRMAFIQEHIDLFDKKVLDVGCGGGILTESLARSGAHANGLDISDELITVAQDHAKQENLSIDYQNITVEDLAGKQAGQYDVVCCMEMLEHVPDPQSVIKACQQLAKPNALLFFSTLNRNIKAYAQAIIAAEYMLKIIPKGTHDFDKFIKPAELAAWLREYNCHVNAMTGITYNPLTKNYTLTKNTSVNYLICATKKEM